MKIIELLEYIDVEKTLQNFGEKLENRAKKDHSAKNLNQRQILEKIMDSDPTGNKGTYVLWIIKIYLNNGLNYLEDLGRLNTALNLFHKFKQKLPQQNRDINKIKSLQELENLVDQFSTEKTKREIKKEIRKEIDKETEILYDGSAGKILIPKTEKASCFWGQGTKWCTASEKNNFFQNYSKEGPLYILITPSGKKFQIHLETDQIKDEKDVDVVDIKDTSNVDKNFINLLEIFFNIVTESESTLKILEFLISKKSKYILKTYIDLLSLKLERKEFDKVKNMLYKLDKNLISHFIKDVTPEIKSDILNNLENFSDTFIINFIRNNPDSDIIEKTIDKKIYLIKYIFEKLPEKLKREVHNFRKIYSTDSIDIIEPNNNLALNFLLGGSFTKRNGEDYRNSLILYEDNIPKIFIKKKPLSFYALRYYPHEYLEYINFNELLASIKDKEEAGKSINFLYDYFKEESLITNLIKTNKNINFLKYIDWDKEKLDKIILGLKKENDQKKILRVFKTIKDNLSEVLVNRFKAAFPFI